MELMCSKQDAAACVSGNAGKVQLATRHHGIDLLRIVAMLMVCVLHVNLTSSALQYDYGGEPALKCCAWGWFISCMGAVNLYAMVTGYVCITSTWRLARYLRLWMQVAFYTMGFFVLRAIFGSPGTLELAPMTAQDWFRAFLPVPFANVYWYFTAYTALFLLMPIVNPLLRSCRPAAFRWLLFLVFAVFCPSLHLMKDTVFAFGYNAAWLLVLYAAGAYVRLHPPTIPRRWLVAGACAGILLAVLYKVLDGQGKLGYTFPPTVLAACCLFLLFEGFDIRNPLFIKIISILAPLSFGVYLVHVHPYPWALLYFYMQRLFGYLGYAWWLFLACPVALYLGCSFVDACRAWLFRLCRASAGADAMERALMRLWHAVSLHLERSIGVWFGVEPERRD